MAGYNPDYIKHFYMNHLADSKVHGDELRAPCPAHDDKNPSFSINILTGAYKCFNPDCKLWSGGGMAKFLSIIEDIPIHEASQKINDDYNALYPPTKPVTKKNKIPNKFPHTQDDITAHVEELLANEERLSWIHTNCLWTLQTIKKFEIGFNKAENAYWIPIRENIEIVNIRKYNPSSTKKWSSVTSFGAARIFPMENVQDATIYIMEGEKDCILANQLGLNAVTVTGGAGTFNSEWKPFFTDKNVIVCYDIDIAGRSGANKVLANLGHVARSIKLIDLPIKTPPNGDFTDYILQGNTVQDFLALVAATLSSNPQSEAPVDIPDEVIETTLDKISEDKLFYRRSKISVRVIGTESSPFIIPKEVCVSCNKDNGPSCFICRVGDKGGKSSLILDETTPRLLDLIECTSKDRAVILKDIFHIPTCRQFQLKEKDHQAVHRVSIIPSIDEIHFNPETQNQKYAERDLYFIGQYLEANYDYEIETLAVPSPKSQVLVHIGYKVKPADSSIEEFRMTVELKKQLEVFQCKSETK